MEKESIVKYLLFKEVTLKNVSSKITKTQKKITGDIISKWEYKIQKIEQDNLIIIANVHTYMLGVFDTKASYIISFEILKPIIEDEIKSVKGYLLYFAGAQHSLLVSFLTNSMFDVPIPIPPNIDEEDITLIDK